MTRSIRPLATAFVLAASALLLGRPVLAEAATTPLHTIRGIATTTSGRPLAAATLYLQDLPGSQYLPSLGGRGTVVTDAQGRFTWTVPADIAWNVPTDVPKDSAAPDCYALPDGPGWRARLAIAPRYDAKYAQRDLLEKATRKCETHWLQTGAAPQMAVVVPETGGVTLTVRRPNGQPLAEQAVQVVAPGTFSDYEGTVIREGKTDAAGRLQMRWYPGLLRLLISVPGVGFGSTGTFEILPGKEATPQMPPLAPFAHVSGMVDSTLVAPGAFVHMDDYEFSEHKWYDPNAAVDAQGRFSLDSILPGEHRLVLVGGKTAAGVNVTVYPGEQVANIVLGSKAKEGTPVLLNAPVKPGEAKPAVHGRVTDTTGRPVAGADVYALCSYYTSHGQYQQVLAAQTGADGAYHIPDLPGGWNGPTVSVVAAVAGRPVAVSSAQMTAVDGTVSADFHADLVLPPGHPGLIVRVLQNGKPQAGASVRLTPQVGVGPFGPSYFGLKQGDVIAAVSKLLEPTIVTDANGEARFTDLVPGLWDVTAVSGGGPYALNFIRRRDVKPSQEVDYNICRGLIVGTGPPRHFTLNVFPRPHQAAFRVLGPDGQPPPNPLFDFQYAPAGGSSGSSASVTLDKDGYGTFDLLAPGLWRIDARFRDTALDTFPANAEPFYEGSAVLAVSSALPPPEPVIIRTVRRGPGRIRVHLLDSDGHPRSGTVFIGDAFDNAKYGASLDTQGEAVFSDMPSGKYLLRANFSAQSAPPSLGHDGEPFPSDAALSGVNLLVPQTIEVKSDEDTVVTFRPQPQGYVRGKVVAPDAPQNYTIYFPYYSDMRPSVRYDAKTGEFVIGPFPAGPTALHIQRTTSGDANAEAAGKNVPVTVEAGRVVHITLTPSPPVKPNGKTEAMLTMGGVFLSGRNRPLAGRVFLPDGKTPAWGARAAVVVPETWPPVQMARADAGGRLSAGDYWYETNTPSDPPPGSPAEPVLVAWLPGANGAVVAPYTPGMDAKLVLPQPALVAGRVTVGGQSVAGLPSSFRVLAAYQGKGKLNALLSVEATAQADGAFTLAGLTPGTYQVQAARDGIWLSETKTLEVGQAALPDLALDIAPPGAAVTVRLVNAQGKPLAGLTVELERPAGPLADALWPKTITPDPTGRLHLEGFEAGQHALRLRGTKIPFSVPPLGQNAPTEEQTMTVKSHD